MPEAVELKFEVILPAKLVSALIKFGSNDIIEFRTCVAAVDTPDAVLPEAQMRLVTPPCKAVANKETIEAILLPDAVEIPLAIFGTVVSNSVAMLIAGGTRLPIKLISDNGIPVPIPMVV